MVFSIKRSVTLYRDNKNKMSHIRNRHNLTSSSLILNDQKQLRKGVGVRVNYSMTPKPTRTTKNDAWKHKTRT